MMRRVFGFTAVVLVLLLGLCSVRSAWADGGRPFITKWKFTQQRELEFPLLGDNFKLVIKDASGKVVKREDKVTVELPARPYKCLLPAGEYTIEAGPEGVRALQMASLNNFNMIIPRGSTHNLTEVIQFGDVKWKNMYCAFAGCENMTFAWTIDTPDLSNVQDMSYMFFQCRAFNQPLNDWKVGKVTKMAFMFHECFSFNQPLNDWDVSQVTNMQSMFSKCRAFNQSLNDWKVGKVTNMQSMFLECTFFNQRLERWNVGEVTNMARMFAGCKSFDQNVNTWNVSKVTEMSDIFSQCSSFNWSLWMWKLKTAIGGLKETAMSPTNYSESLVWWAKQEGIRDIKFGREVSGLIYNAEGKAAREKLMKRGWTFDGDREQDKGIFIVMGTPRYGSVKETSLSVNEERAVEIEVWGKGVKGRPKVQIEGAKDVLQIVESNMGKRIWIKGLKDGEVTLKVTLDEYSDECKIKVETVRVRSVQVTLATHNIKRGDAIPLWVDIQPANASEKGFTVTMSNDLATYDPATGEIVANKKQNGEVTVTVKTNQKGSSAPAVVRKVKIVSPDRYRITLEKEGEGTLELEGHQEATSVEVEKWTELTVMAAADESKGYELTALTAGDIDLLKQENKFEVTGAVTVKATFTLKTFAVETTKEGEGTVTIAGADNLAAVPYGTELTVTATADESKGYELTALTAGDIDLLRQENKFVVKGAVTVKATFTLKTFAVETTKEGEGTITIAGADNLAAVPYGTELTVTATADESKGYELTALMAGDIDLLKQENKFVVKGAVTVKATFTKKTFAVETTKEGEGTITIAGADNLAAVPYGTELTVTATADESKGYELTALMAGDIDLLKQENKFVVKGAVTVKATFTKKTFAVETTKEGEGTITIAGADNLAAVPYGTELTVTATADESKGYELTALMAGDIDLLKQENKFVVKGAVTVKATFTQKTFAVETTKEGEGTISIAGADNLAAVPYGTELTVTATSAEGYELKELKANDVDIKATKTFTVTAATTVTAVFEKKQGGETPTPQPDPKPTTFAVTLAKPEHGKIAIEGYTEEALKTVVKDTELTVTATHDDGYELKELKANNVDIKVTKKFTVTAATTVTAVFEKKQGGKDKDDNKDKEPGKPGTAVEDAVLAGISVAPNPFTSQLRIVNPEGIVARYTLVNTLGGVVRSGVLSGTEVVDTEALPAGLYFVRVIGQNGATRVLRVVK
ncbi:MAG: BspA family leucine-rich repeat surface protein [Bacteroides sp.]